MSLKMKVVAPGGFESSEGYRRLIGIQVDFINNTVMIARGDYKDEATRRANQHAFVNNFAYKLDIEPTKARNAAYEDKDGNAYIEKIEAIPSGSQFLDLPIETYFPEVTPATTIREILSKIGYGFLKSRKENENSSDV